MGYIYLASPYSHPDPDTLERRFEAACRGAAELMEEGNIVFSPIVHSHPVEKLGMEQTYGWEFWKHQDIEFLKDADKVVVLMLDGWEDSIGVSEEIRIAEAAGIPVEYRRVGSTPAVSPSIR